jgi:hypothetical protein
LIVLIDPGRQLAAVPDTTSVLVFIGRHAAKAMGASWSFELTE